MTNICYFFSECFNGFSCAWYSTLRIINNSSSLAFYLLTEIILIAFFWSFIILLYSYPRQVGSDLCEIGWELYGSVYVYIVRSYRVIIVTTNILPRKINTNIAASNLYCKITLVWVDSSLSAYIELFIE